MTNFIETQNPDGSIEYIRKDAEELIRQGAIAEANVVRTELTPEQLAESELIQQRNTAKQYLASTDWYAARKAEIGTAIPADVLEKRQQARVTLSS